MIAAIASTCKKKPLFSKLSYHFYTNLPNSNQFRVTLQPIIKGLRGFTTFRRNINLLRINYIKYFEIHVSRSCLLVYIPRTSAVNMHPLSTKASPPEETNDETLNQILAAIENPSVFTEEILTTSIKKLCTSGKLFTAARLMQIVRCKNIFLNPCTYNYLLEASAENGNIDLLSETFKNLLNSREPIRLTSYLILARAFGKNDNPTLIKFIGEVSEMELPRKDIVFNRLIFAFAKCGQVEKAVLIFNHMKSLKIKPDLFTYNTLLVILGRMGRVDDMLQEFDYMKTIDIIPDIVTYNTVLNCLRKMGRLDSCLACFKEMVERGIQPDMLTFKDLIESLGRSGRIEEAREVFDEMKSKGIYPSVYVYRALIFSLKKMGKMELALKYSKEMNELPISIVPRDFRLKNR